MKTNCPAMLNTTKAIKQDYANHAMIESNILHGIKLIQRLMADMVQAVANADECKRLYDKRDIINECLEDAAYSNAHIIVNTASAILSAPIMKAYNEAACSFKCLTQATTFAEYSEQRQYFINRRNVFNFRCHNVQVASTDRYNAAMKWVEYYNKQIAYWAAARLPKSSTPKNQRKALTRSYINNRVTKPEYFVNADTANRVIYARLAVILKRGVERAYINASTCASIKSVVQFHKTKNNYYHPMYGLAAALRWAQEDRKAYLSHSPQGRTLYINRLPV